MAQPTVTVQVLPLADIVADAGLQRIDCLKVDVEGLEAEVIQPFLRTAPRRLRPRRMIVELKGDGESDELARWIVSRGYVLELRTKLNGLFRRALSTGA